MSWDRTSYLDINHCDIEGGEPGLKLVGVVVYWGSRNWSIDPLFRNPEEGDYHLMSQACDDSLDSPCIDTGDPAISDRLLDCSWGLGYDRSDMGAYGGGKLATVGIGDQKQRSAIPRSLSLSQNYPNPFNPSTTIAFDIPGTIGSKPHISLSIYDIRDRRVRMLVDSELKPGNHQVHWNGQNDRGESVASGIYLYRLKAGEETFTRKMMVLK